MLLFLLLLLIIIIIIYFGFLMILKKNVFENYSCHLPWSKPIPLYLCLSVGSPDDQVEVENSWTYTAVSVKFVKEHIDKLFVSGAVPTVVQAGAVQKNIQP